MSRLPYSVLKKLSFKRIHRLSSFFIFTSVSFCNTGRRTSFQPVHGAAKAESCIKPCALQNIVCEMYHTTCVKYTAQED